jgi:hypothetical protein
LTSKGYKCCTGYDCFGAGQKICEVTFSGVNWKQNSDVAKQMFDGFIVMRALHEILWYLSQAYIYNDEEKSRIENLNKIGIMFTGITYEEQLFLNKCRSKLIDKLDKNQNDDMGR